MIFFIPISIAAIESLFAFALLFFVIKKIVKPEFKFLENYAYLFLMFFLYFSVASFINSIYLKKSIMALVCKWLEYILIFVIAHDNFSNNTKRIRNAILILLFITGITLIDGIFQYFVKVDFLRHNALTLNDNRIKAAFKNANDFGAYLVPFLLITMALLLDPKLKKRLKHALFLLLFFLCLCLILTFSRGAWMGLFAGLFLLLFFSKKKRIFYALICITAIFISVPILRSRIVNIFQPGGDAFRFRIWPVAISMIKENPFLGKGVGTFMAYFSKYPTNLSPQYAHNCFLQIWAETGIFSLISFLLFAGLLLYRGIKKFRKNSDPVLLGLVCGVFGFLAHSFFDTNLYSLQLATLFWILMGMISAKLSNIQ